MIVRQSASTAPLVARASQRRPAPPLIFRGSPSHALERAAASKPKEKAPRRKAATARPLHKSAGPAAANCRPGYHESSCVRSHGKESWFLLPKVPPGARLARPLRPGSVYPFSRPTGPAAATGTGGPVGWAGRTGGRGSAPAATATPGSTPSAGPGAWWTAASGPDPYRRLPRPPRRFPAPTGRAAAAATRRGASAARPLGQIAAGARAAHRRHRRASVRHGAAQGRYRPAIAHARLSPSGAGTTPRRAVTRVTRPPSPHVRSHLPAPPHRRDIVLIPQRPEIAASGPAGRWANPWSEEIGVPRSSEFAGASQITGRTPRHAVFRTHHAEFRNRPESRDAQRRGHLTAFPPEAEPAPDARNATRPRAHRASRRTRHIAATGRGTCGSVRGGADGIRRPGSAAAPRVPRTAPPAARAAPGRPAPDGSPPRRRCGACKLHRQVHGNPTVACRLGFADPCIEGLMCEYRTTE